MPMLLKIKIFFLSVFLSGSLLSFVWAQSSALSKEKESDDAKALLSVSRAFRRVAKEVGPSVVTITARYGALSGGSHVYRGKGTGLIWDGGGNIITNHHLVDGARELEVELASGEIFSGNLLGSDPRTDLALLHISPKDKKLIPAKFADSDQVQVGDWAIAIGTALEFDQTVTVGIVSAKNRRGLRSQAENPLEDFIQTDAAINRGNSGGPLCNIEGKVIGINAMIVSSSGGSQGLGFSIPINFARRVVEEFNRGGHFKRGFLGIVSNRVTEDWAKLLNYKGTHGVVVEDLLLNGPAHKAGLKTGDIMLVYDGKTIHDERDLFEAMSRSFPNSKIKIRIYRNQEERELELVVGEPAKEENKAVNALGLLVRTPTKDELDAFGASEGVVVEKIIRGTLADIPQLQVGYLLVSFNHTPLHSPEELYALVSKSFQAEQSMLLHIRSHERETVVLLER